MNGKSIKWKCPLTAWPWVVVSVLLASLSVAWVVRYSLRIRPLNAAQFRQWTQDRTDGNDVTKLVAQDRKRLEGFKKDNLFAPAPPPQNPVREILGILGDEALINGQPYKVGAQIGDAKIVAIDAMSVTVEWDGKQSKFYPIESGGGGSGGGSGRGGSRGSRGSRPPGGSGPSVTVGPPAPSSGRSGPLPGGAISDEEKAKIEKMSPEEQQSYFMERSGGAAGGSTE